MAQQKELHIDTISLIDIRIQEQLTFVHKRRYAANPLLNEVYSIANSGMYLDLQFTFTNEVYCSTQYKTCTTCTDTHKKNCAHQLFVIDSYSIHIDYTYFNTIGMESNLFANKVQGICNTIKPTLLTLSQYTSDSNFLQLYIQSNIHLLLIQIAESCSKNCTQQYNCKFLAHSSEREKIASARAYILKHIGQPISIKQLSKTVAMNDCYLKKGFKEMYGQTINEYYQSQRMTYAKNLLYEKGLTVTEVSQLLGFSSISHFSSSFKKYTGVKPCELLIR